MSTLPPPTRPPDARRRRILLLDDSATVLEMTQLALEGGGYEVIAASSAASLPSLLNQHRPDLALIDVNMPVMEGPSVVELLQRSQLHRCPFVLYSDQPAERLRELAAGCGAAGFIRKTSRAAELLGAVEPFLGPRLERAVLGARLEALLVATDPAVRSALEEAAHGEGFDVAVVASTAEGLTLLAKGRTAALFVDLGLAPDGGDACCRAVREERAWGGLPIVMVASTGSTAEVMRCWRAGADDFLARPLRAAQVGAKLAAVRAAREASSSVPRNADAGHLLLADHSSFYRGRLGKLLEGSGHRVLYARTAEEALALATAHGAALQGVLVDLELPGSPPVELIGALRRATKAVLLPTHEGAAPSAAAAEAERLTGNAPADKALPCEHVVGRIQRLLRPDGAATATSRVPFFASIEFRRPADAAWRSGFTYDLSESGLFVTTMTPEPPGTLLELAVVFPGLGPITLTGRVAWANALAPRTAWSYMVGMGVALTAVEPTTAKQLAQYVASVGRRSAR